MRLFLGVIVIFGFLYFVLGTTPALDRISIFYGVAGGCAATLSLIVNLLFKNGSCTNVKAEVWHLRCWRYGINEAGHVVINGSPIAAIDASCNKDSAESNVGKNSIVEIY